MKKKYRYRGCRGRMKKRISCNATVIFDLREKFEKIINEQDKILAAVQKDTREARIILEKKLYSTIYGNKRFAEDVSKKSTATDEDRSMFRRMSYLLDVCGRLLASDGVCPVAPVRNQLFDAGAHRAVATVVRESDDIPDAICECLEVGYMVDGVMNTPADVVVFENI